MSEQQQGGPEQQQGGPRDERGGSPWATWTTQSIISGPGGVTTAEVGPISGDLTVHTTWADGEVRLTVQYTGALDWYTVAGSPVPAADEATARAIHQAVVNGVKAGGGARAPQVPQV